MPGERLGGEGRHEGGAACSAASQLGAGTREAKLAWKKAAHAQERAERAALERQARTLAALDRAREAALGNGAGGDAPLGILLAAHPYVAHDPHLLYVYLF